MGHHLIPKLKRIKRFTNSVKEIDNPTDQKSHSFFSLILKEKQKCKFYYELLERKLKNYSKNIFSKVKLNNITDILEKRLDVCLLRSNFATTLREARHLISYGHIFVNQKQIKIPSFLSNQGDYISLNPKSKKIQQKIKSRVWENKQTPQNTTTCPKTCRIFIKRKSYPREKPLKINDSLISKYYYKH